MSDIYLSCTTCSLRGRGIDEIEETFRYAAGAGYEHWGLGGPITYEAGLIQWLDTKALKQRMKAAGLTSCTEVYSTGILNTSAKEAEQSAEQIVPAARAAVDLECPRVVFSGCTPRLPGGIEKTILGLKRLLELVSDLPVNICLEPHRNSQIIWMDDYDRIFSEID